MVGDGCAGPPYASIWSDHAFGRIGWAWRETDVEDTDYETVINDLLEGQFANPVRVIGFNTAEGWSRDVSEDVARISICNA